MNKIKIITDSTADLSKEIIDKYDIEVIPLLVTFGEESYKDGIDINTSELLRKMESSEEFPGTAQITPQRFIECYKKYLQEGYKIISLHLSSKMSGTYQSACLAKEILEANETIEIIDSQNVTSGLGLLVIKAARLRDEEYNLEEIVKEVRRTIPHIKSGLVFEELTNLVKGGRLSKTAGVVGNILGIRPILTVENGEMAVIDKVRGNKKAIRYVLDYIGQVGIKKDEPCILLHIENEDIRIPLEEHLQEKSIEFMECEVGCVVGVHSGKRACGIFFIENY
ncbi:DegV family protein [Clostridium tetani]|uniref:DegV protein n=2 Tax=Clostridium tetani TaxID=1513 RepID=Q898S4_CLOTE|nr:DegV family protein [Clostridium tetani]AAO35005.1 degV protein [Clostridium tetani E88]AVP54901.1 DegV family protein [Clostridium tetani]KGI37392.1 DegV domain-containing protein [Clostridium tetani ATCC 9441]KGI40796.1 DegV domain-containing protein [Clostridium tetani]KGI44272.1 DegV domain-containing protein [Clostridium tetani]